MPIDKRSLGNVPGLARLDPVPSIYPVLSVTFVGSLGFSIVLPFLVFLVTRFGGNAVVYGLMGATYSFFQLIGAPLLGRWSDRIGRRKVLLVSQFGTMGSWAVFLTALVLPVVPLLRVESGAVGAFQLTLPLLILFIARAFDGLTGGNVSVANAYLADITTEAERSRNFGRMAVATNLGFIAGPALAGLLGASRWGEALPVLAALLISLAGCALILFYLPDSDPCALSASPEKPTVRKVLGQEQRDCYTTSGGTTLTTRAILGLRGLPPILVVYFLVFLAFNLFYVTFPVYAALALEWSLRETGIFFSFLSFFMVIVQGPILGRAAKVWSDGSLVIWGSLILALSFLLFTARNPLPLYFGAALLALGNGLMWPSLMALLSSSVDPKVQGAVQGLAASLGAIASIVGLVVGGILYEAVGSKVFFLSTGVVASTFVISAARFRKGPKSRSTAGITPATEGRSR